MIGILGAFDDEIANLKNSMNMFEYNIDGSCKYFYGTIYNIEVVLASTGMGKVNAAMCTQLLIDKYSIDKVINIGIAGAIKNDVFPGDIVISTDSIQYDFDISSVGCPIGVIPGIKSSFFLSDSKMRDILKRYRMIHNNNSIIEARVISGDRFITDQYERKRLYDCFQAACVDMEGAAIAHVAQTYSIPHILIKSISDEVNSHSYSDIKKNKLQAIRNCTDIILFLLHELSEIE